MRYSHLSSGNSSIGATCWSPALFTRMSTPPSSSIAAWTSARQSSRRETSPFRKLPPIDEASSAPLCSSRSATRTRAPRSAKSIAIARPIPLAPPVMSALLPERSIPPFTRRRTIRSPILPRTDGFAIETRGVTKEFVGFRAVNGVDLRLEAGRVHALVGPNGAGKTSLFNLLTGFLRPTAGRVVILGGDTTGLPPEGIARRGVARSFQITSLFDQLTVLEHAELALQAASTLGYRFWSSEGALERYRPRSRELLAEVGLADLANRSAGKLPYRQKRALGLRLAIPPDPRLRLLI